MTIEKRLKTIQLINKVERNQKFSKKIGTLNISSFEGAGKTNGVVQEIENK